MFILSVGREKPSYIKNRQITWRSSELQTLNYHSWTKTFIPLMLLQIIEIRKLLVYMNLIIKVFNLK